MSNNTAPKQLFPIFNQNKFLQDQFITYKEADKRYQIYPDKNRSLNAVFEKRTTFPESNQMYIRWKITRILGTGNPVQASEFKLYNGNTEINLQQPFISISTDPPASSPPNEQVGNLIDGIISTKFLDFNFGTNGFTSVILFSSQYFFFDAYSWGTANDFPPRDPFRWTLEISPDGVNYTLLDQRDQYFAINNLQRFTIQPKFLFSIPITTKELQPTPFLATPASNPKFLPTHSSAYTSGGVTFLSYLAFDGNSTTFWHSNIVYNTNTGVYIGSVSTAGIAGEWIEVESNQPFTLSRFVIYPRIGLEDERSPQNMVLLGSNNRTNWTSLGSWTNIGGVGQNWSAGPKEFFITPSRQRYYRFITTLVGAIGNIRSSVQIAQLLLYSEDTVPINYIGTPSDLPIPPPPYTPASKVDEWGQFTQSTVFSQPTFISSSSPFYVVFNRPTLEHLSTPSITMNVSTNGGFTFVFRIMFISTPGSYERVFDFAHGPNDRMIICGRFITTSQMFFRWRISNGNDPITINTPVGFIVQNEWMNVWLVYDASNATFTIYKNGVLISQQTGINTSLVTDRTTPINYIGRSVFGGDAYVSMNLQGFLAYDRLLTVDELETATDIVNGINEINTAPSNPVISLTIRDLFNTLLSLNTNDVVFPNSSWTTEFNGWQINADNTPLLVKNGDTINNTTYTLWDSQQSQSIQHAHTRNPNGLFRLSNYSLMLGGVNDTGSQIDSCEIVAGLFGTDRLSIVGRQPAGITGANRRLRIYGDVELEGGDDETIKWYFNEMNTSPVVLFLYYGERTETITLTANTTTYTWTNLPFNFYTVGLVDPFFYFKTTIYPTDEMFQINPTLISVDFNDVSAPGTPLRTILLAYDGGVVPTGIPFQIKLTWFNVG